MVGGVEAVTMEDTMQQQYIVKAIGPQPWTNVPDEVYLISRDGEARHCIVARELSYMGGPVDPFVVELRTACAKGKVIQFKAA